MIGAGGIGFDVSEFLTHASSPTLDLDEWQREWGVTDPEVEPGGLTKGVHGASPRKVHLLQRKTSKVGAGLGKTSGWVHRASLQHRGVEMLGGVAYERIDDAGLHIRVGADKEGKGGEPRTLEGRHDRRVRRPGAAPRAAGGARRGRAARAPRRWRRRGR